MQASYRALCELMLAGGCAPPSLCACTCGVFVWCWTLVVVRALPPGEGGSEVMLAYRALCELVLAGVRCIVHTCAVQLYSCMCVRCVLWCDAIIRPAMPGGRLN